jgi:hypothetical protein
MENVTNIIYGRHGYEGKDATRTRRNGTLHGHEGMEMRFRHCESFQCGPCQGKTHTALPCEPYPDIRICFRIIYAISIHHPSCSRAATKWPSYSCLMVRGLTSTQCVALFPLRGNAVFLHGICYFDTSAFVFVRLQPRETHTPFVSVPYGQGKHPKKVRSTFSAARRRCVSAWDMLFRYISLRVRVQLCLRIRALWSGEAPKESA